MLPNSNNKKYLLADLRNKDFNELVDLLEKSDISFNKISHTEKKITYLSIGELCAYLKTIDSTETSGLLLLYREIEAEFINTIVDNMSKDVTVSKEDLKFTKGNAEVLRLFIINKIILEDAKKNNFEKEEKANLKILEDNVLLNYYADRTVKDKIRISQQEIEQIYNDNKESFGNMPVENAYNQIGNSLVTQKATQLKQELSNQVAKEYDIETEIEKYNL